jgi:enoyl-CoA hydratase
VGYEHLEVEFDGQVATIWLNRPEKLNAMCADMWDDLPRAMAEIDAEESIRVVLLAGRGLSFTVGIDIEMLSALQPDSGSQPAANARIYQTIRHLQRTATCLAESSKPVLAVVQGHCLGAGMDLITACDIRIAASDATFSVRETRMGLVADVGTLQRLPVIVCAGHTAELALTGDDIDAETAHRIGLVNHVGPDHESALAYGRALAGRIAANSPIVTQGVKRVLAANDGRTVDEALDYVAQWNASHLLSTDLSEAVAAFLERRDPDFTGH